MNPPQAPIVIIPSMPMFSRPESSATISPSAAYRMGVAIRIIAAPMEIQKK